MSSEFPPSKEEPVTYEGELLETNPIVELVPANRRRRLYALFGLLGILISAVFVGYGAVPGTVLPSWLLVASAIYNFLAVPFSGLALMNTKRP